MAKLIKSLSAVYCYINILSIDVAIGACIMSLFIASLVQVTIPYTIIISLATTVWLIYTVDHLKDAKAIKHVSHTNRHKFHQIHYEKLKIAVWSFLPFQMTLLFFLPLPTLLAGFLLMLIVFFYFLILWYLNIQKIYHKELIIALVYTCGVFLPVLHKLDFEIAPHLLIIFFQIVLLAFSNLLIFSLMEMSSDKIDNQPSLALVFGRLRTKKIILSVLLVGLFFSFVLLLSNNNIVFRSGQVIIIIMNLILISILSFKYFINKERFRYLGDAIFYLPLLHLLWL